MSQQTPDPATHGETIGDTVVVQVAGHPPRTDSPEYVKSRKALQNSGQGCIVCGGLPIEDHHGGGIYVGGKIVGFNLFGMEWSQGFGTKPEIVQAHVDDLNPIMAKEGEATYDLPITDTDGVMAWIDSTHNANVPICKSHHTGHELSHTPDANGHEAVGVHNIPFPIWLGQIGCDWDKFDMWGGSTGTVTVAPAPNGAVKVLRVSALHPDKALFAENQAALAAGVEHILPASHTHARLAHAGAKKG